MSESGKTSADCSDSPKLSLKIKAQNQEETKVEIDGNSDVSELRSELAKLFKQDVDRICLIYGGKIMKDGNDVVSYGVKNHHSIHLVIRAPPVTRPNPQADATHDSETTRPSPTRAPGSTPGMMPIIINGAMHEIEDPGIHAAFDRLLNNPVVVRELENSRRRYQDPFTPTNNGNSTSRAYNPWAEDIQPRTDPSTDTPVVPNRSATQATSTPPINPFATLAAGRAHCRPPATQSPVQTIPESQKDSPNQTKNSADSRPATNETSTETGQPEQGTTAVSGRSDSEPMRLLSDPRGIAALRELNQAYSTLRELAPSLFSAAGQNGPSQP